MILLNLCQLQGQLLTFQFVSSIHFEPAWKPEEVRSLKKLEIGKREKEEKKKSESEMRS